MSLSQEDEAIDFLNLPDDEFEKFGDIEPRTSSSDSDEEEQEQEQEDSLESEEEDNQEEEESSNDNDSDDEDDLNDPESSDDEEESSEEESEESEEEEGEEQDEESETELSDAEAFFKELTTPFKANNQEVQIKSAEEAKRLIQQGLGYTKNMTEIKPYRRFLKTLEQNKLLSEDKISFAVDLLTGNKDAIVKLIKDNGVNPLEIDVDGAGEYKPSTEIAPQLSVDFDDEISNIKDSPHYDATVKTLQGFDEASQREVIGKPAMVADLHAQIESGMYDAINQELAHHRAVNNPSLQGMSDLQAYVAVGNYLAQQGKLDAFRAQNADNPAPSKRKVIPKAQPKSNPKTAAKKKGAGMPRSAPKPSASNNINPLDLSDEEFDRLYGKS